MKLKLKYQLILYYIMVITIVICAFFVYILQQSRDFSMSNLKDELKEYNLKVYDEYKSGIPFSGIQLPDKIRCTIIDTNYYVVYHNSEGTSIYNERHNTRDEIVEASAKGEGLSLRYSTTMDGEYLYYARKYPEFYIRTSIPYKYEKIKLEHPHKEYQYAIVALIISLLITLVYISNRLTAPLKAFYGFFEMVKSNKKDFSAIQFPDNEYGEVGRKIVDTYNQLEQAKQFKQQVTHNIAHELKTPLTGIRGYLETILRDESMPPKMTRKFIERAYKQAMRLTSLVNDVSVLNKLDEQSDYYKIEDVNISACLKEIEEELELKLKENNTVFNPLISSELSIGSNHDIIYSLFKNLIDNTLEHAGPDTTITIMAGISQISGESGYRINFTYMDNGKGIPEKALDKLFDRFYRVDEGRTRKSGGSGLGLSIVKNAVVFHKGDITAENNPEGGIIFKFSLMSL